jgi:hypothetical protein
MFSIQQAAGKGFGIFATQKILRGQRILTDSALLSVHGPNADILHSARKLGVQAKQSLLSLSTNQSKHASPLSWLESLWLSRWSLPSVRTNHSMINIFRNNNFNIGDSVRAVFPVVARINHACVPNSQGNFNTSLGAFTVHAVHDVFLGEEITLSYLDDQLGLREWRRTLLRERYGFECNCAICDATVGDTHEKRRASLRQKLKQFAEKADGSSEHAENLDEFTIMTALLKVYEEEGIRGREAATL